MSIDLIKPAYQTRLGNPTAKNVLVILAHEVNNRGYGWPSIQYIAGYTEASDRTVFRMIQIFEEIGLLKRAKSPHNKFAVQLNLDLLGKDLTVPFRKAHMEANKKIPRKKPVRSVAATEKSVAATEKSVAATVFSVAATEPPHPHIGGPVIDPLETLTPPTPLPPGRGDGDGHNPAVIPKGDNCRNGYSQALKNFARLAAITDPRLLRRLEPVVDESGVGEEELYQAWKEYINCPKRIGKPMSLSTFYTHGHWRNRDSWIMVGFK